MIRALFSTRLVQGAILSKVCTTLGFVGSRHGSWMYTRMWQPIDHGSELYPEDVRQLPDYEICEGKHTPTSFLVGTYTMYDGSNRCTTNSPLISPRTVCIWQTSFPLIFSMVNWRIRRTSLSRYAFCRLSVSISPAYSACPTPFKSIVALRAASEIFQILGNSDKSQQYGVRYPTLPCC